MDKKAATKAKNKYNAKAYDRLFITVPKGMKDLLKAYCEKHDKTVNGLINECINNLLNGGQESEWIGNQVVHCRYMLRTKDKATGAINGYIVFYVRHYACNGWDW